MNPVEVGLILDRLGTAYRTEVPPEALEVWSTHLAGVDPEIGMDAVENVIGMEDFFPTVAVFQREVGHVIRQRARDEVSAQARGEGTPRSDCELCAGQKWYEVDPVPEIGEGGEIIGYSEQWKPCQTCAPVEFSRWLEHRAEMAAVSRHRKSRGPDADPLDLETALAEAKAKLAATKPPPLSKMPRRHEP